VDLRGQVVLITGGSRGLGLALARQFVREGCRLMICARDAGGLDRAAADLIAAGAEVHTFVCDVADRTAVARLIGATLDRYGRLDILVNNAGVIQVGPVATMTVEDFEEAMGVMFLGDGLLHACRVAAPQGGKPDREHHIDRRQGCGAAFGPV
jgi:NAD(P)-dependent dehydrogenase (short-subunit alcohol dehydrogenase family)